MRFAHSIVVVVVAVAAAAAAACGTTAPPPARTPAMPSAPSSDANKQLLRRLYTDYINPGHLDRLGEIVAPDFVGPSPQPGPAGFAAAITGLRAGFPDLVYTVEDVVAEGDRVAVRWSWRGTHTGAFRTFAPTGKQVVNSGFAIFQVADGKMV